MDPDALQTRVTPTATVEEAAAIAAALTRFTQDAAVLAVVDEPTQTLWQRSALAEGVARAVAWE